MSEYKVEKREDLPRLCHCSKARNGCRRHRGAIRQFSWRIIDTETGEALPGGYHQTKAEAMRVLEKIMGCIECGLPPKNCRCE